MSESDTSPKYPHSTLTPGPSTRESQAESQKETPVLNLPPLPNTSQSVVQHNMDQVPPPSFGSSNNPSGQIQAPLDQQPVFADEAVEIDSRTASTVSTPAEVFQLMEEHGRKYPNFGKYWYGLPVDQGEQDRMTRLHKHYSSAQSPLHAPIQIPPQRILDLGTGNGEWAIAMADAFPSAIVTGADIAPVQPETVPLNCNFEIQDIEDDWTQEDNTFDIIHLREPLLMIRNWPRLFGQVKRCLKPGGWFEVSCTHLPVRCDDGSIPASAVLNYVSRKLVKASDRVGVSLDCPLHFAKDFQAADFTNLQVAKHKLPLSPWPADEKTREIGVLERRNLSDLSESIGLRLFHKAFDWPPPLTSALMAAFRAELKTLSYHPYYERYIVCGQKPEE